MNNRYLCRAKRKNCRGLPKEKWWVEGCYAYMQPYHYIMPKDNFDSWIEIDEKTLCACTGLKDKNGKLIWENDIVNCFEAECCGKISWNESEAGFYFDVLLEDGTYEEEHIYDYADCMDVIGNIFDNPELLEVGE